MSVRDPFEEWLARMPRRPRLAPRRDDDEVREQRERDQTGELLFLGDDQDDAEERDDQDDDK